MCRKKELDEQKMLAHIMHTAIQCGTPADSRESATKQKRAWQQFIENFNWGSLMKKAKSRENPDPMKAFMALGMSPVGSKGIIQHTREIR